LWDQPILQDSVNGHTCPPCGRRSSRLEGGLGGIHALREISLIITIDQHTDGNAAIPSGLCPRQARATVILAPLADGALPVWKGGWGGFMHSGKFRLLLPSINTPMETQRFRQVFALDRLGQRSYLPPLRTALFPSGRGVGGIHARCKQCRNSFIHKTIGGIFVGNVSA